MILVKEVIKGKKFALESILGGKKIMSEIADR